MAKASDVDTADANGAGPQAADRMAFGPQGAARTAADATGGEPLTSQPDASQPDISQGPDPSEGSDASEGSAVESRQVGPGRPPRKTQWKKGGPSPNPRGRPRKDKTMLPDVKKAFEQALNKKVSVPRGGRQVLMTRLEIGFEQLLNQFAKGDRHAGRDLMHYANILGVDLSGKSGAIEEVLGPSYQAVLDTYFARRSAVTNDAAAPRELAPPALLDDDGADDRPVGPEAAPEAETKPMVPMPIPIPGINYPKPPEQMTPMALSAWYPEWYAKYGKEWETQRLETQRREALRLEAKSLEQQRLQEQSLQQRRLEQRRLRR
jgi:hypothetical protein